MKKSIASNMPIEGSQSRGQKGKPSNWMTLALIVFLGTGLSLALATSLMTKVPSDEEESKEKVLPFAGSPPAGSLPSAEGSGQASQPTAVPPVRFPTPDTEITDARLKTELLAMAERLVAEFGSSPDSLHAAAMTFAEFKQTTRAQEVWQKCIELKPKAVGPYIGLASVLSQRGDEEQAVRLLQNAMSLGQSSAELIADLAGGLSKLGELEQADKVLIEGQSLFPNSVELLTQRGTIDMQLQKVDSAELAFRKAIELGGNNQSLRIMLANALRRQGKTEEVNNAPVRDETTKPAVPNEKSPDFDQLYLNTLRRLAVQLFQMGSRAAVENGKPLLAEEWLLRTLAIEPNDLSTYMELSATYRRSNRPQEALQVQQKLLELQPKNVLNYINLASVASQLGRYDLAEQVLTEAIRVSPETAFPFAELAKIHMGKREVTKAKQMITSARKLEPTNIEWHVMGAMISEALGDASGVVECLRRALEISPEDQQLIALLKAAEAAK